MIRRKEHQPHTPETPSEAVALGNFASSGELGMSDVPIPPVIMQEARPKLRLVQGSAPAFEQPNHVRIIKEDVLFDGRFDDPYDWASDPDSELRQPFDWSKDPHSR